MREMQRSYYKLLATGRNHHTGKKSLGAILALWEAKRKLAARSNLPHTLHHHTSDVLSEEAL